MKQIQEIIGFVTFAAIFWFIGYSCCLSTVPRTNSVRAEIPREGYYFTTGRTQRAYKDGIELDILWFQELIGVEIDGKLGWLTAEQVMLYNNMDDTIAAGTR